MSFSVTTHPERLPVIPEPTLVINRGTDDILLGDNSSSIVAYGAHIPPNGNLIYDLSRQRWIAAKSGTQTYDLLPGGASAIPGSLAIANDILNSGLAASIASLTTTDLLASGLSAQIATQVLNTGTRVIDVPVTSSWGFLDHAGTTGIFDVTDAQSFVIPWFWTNINAANASNFGELTLTWYDTAGGANIVGKDVYEIAGDLNSPGTTFTTETGYIRGPCMGGGLQMSFLGKPNPPGGLGFIGAAGKLIKSYRMAPISKWSTDASADRILLTNLQSGVGASAASSFVKAAPYDGLVEIHCWCAQVAAGTTTHVRFGWGSDTFPTSPVFRDVMFFPQSSTLAGTWISRQVSGGSRRPMWFQFFNGEAAARDFTVTLTCPTLA